MIVIASPSYSINLNLQKHLDKQSSNDNSKDNSNNNSVISCSKLININSNLNKIIIGLRNGVLLIYEFYKIENSHSQFNDTNTDDNDTDTDINKTKNNLYKDIDFKLLNEIESDNTNFQFVNKIQISNDKYTSINKIEFIQSLNYVIVLLSNGTVKILNINSLEIEENLSEYNSCNIIKTYDDFQKIDNSNANANTTNNAEDFNGFDHLNNEMDTEYSHLVSPSRDFDDTISLATVTTANNDPTVSPRKHRFQNNTTILENEEFTNDLILNDNNNNNNIEEIKRSYLCIGSKRNLIVFKWVSNEFKSKLTYKISDKIMSLEFLSSTKLLCVLKNKEIILIDLINSEPTLALKKLNTNHFLNNLIENQLDPKLRDQSYLQSQLHAHQHSHSHSHSYSQSQSSIFSFLSRNEVPSQIVKITNNLFIISKELIGLKVDEYGELAFPINNNGNNTITTNNNNSLNSHHNWKNSPHIHSNHLNPLMWSNDLKFLKFWFPYLVLVTNTNYIQIRDIETGSILQEFKLNNDHSLIIISVEIINSNLYVLTNNNKFYIFQKLNYKLQLEQFKSNHFYDYGINLIEKLNPFLFNDKNDLINLPRQLKFLKLREFQLLKASKLLKSLNLVESFHLFTEYMAPPDLVLSNLPQEIIEALNVSSYIKRTPTSGSELVEREINFGSVASFASTNPDITGNEQPPSTATSTLSNNHEKDLNNNQQKLIPPPKAAPILDIKSYVSELLPYLTDCRRKLNRLLNPDSPTFQYKGIFISRSIYLPESNEEEDDQGEGHGHTDTELNSKLEHGFNETENKLLGLSKLVDTTLFSSYLLTNSRMVGPLLRVNNNCDNNIIINNLKSRKMYRELIDFYFTKNLHKDALDLLFDLGNNEDNDDGNSTNINNNNNNSGYLKGPIPTINYLQKLNNDYLDLIFEYCQWPISLNSEYFDLIFMNDTIECESLNHLKIIDFLNNSSSNTTVDDNDELFIKYLEYLVYNQNENSTKIHTLLIENYLKNLNEIKYIKLIEFYQFSKNYDPTRVIELIDKRLKKFNDNKKIENEFQKNQYLNLLRIKIQPLKLLNLHNLALSIIVYNLQDHDLAINYCNKLYEEDDTLKEETLENLLFNIYLSPKLPYRPDIENAIKLMNLQSSRLSFYKILNNLPLNINISDLSTLLTNQLRLLETNIEKTRILSSLYKVDAVNTKYEYLKLSNKNVIIDNDSKCIICNKRLGHSVLNILPNGKILHYGCTKMYKNL